MTRHYRRDDGALMIEVRPGQFVNEQMAARLGFQSAAESKKTRVKGAKETAARDVKTGRPQRRAAR